MVSTTFNYIIPKFSCMTLTYNDYRLQLRETFKIAYGNYDYRDSLTVALSTNGETGFGECVAINYYNIDLRKFKHDLESVKDRLHSLSIIHPLEFYSFLLTLELHPFLRSAMDCAYWDLFGKLENRTFAEVVDLHQDNLPESSFTINVAGFDEQFEKIKASKWNRFKVKCNGLDRGNVFKLPDSGKEVALDSNTSFTEEDCIFLESQTLTQGFSYLEQPLPTGRFSVLTKNKNAHWMCDEDCQSVEDLQSLSSHYRSVNIKVMKLGGITPALEMISAAHSFGFKVMIGCMTESTVGISAGMALAELCDYADLDGANLISNDFAEGSKVVEGKLLLSEAPGLGIRLI